MTKGDLQIHATIARRLLERAKVQEVPNETVIAILSMMEQEYRTAHEIVPLQE